MSLSICTSCLSKLRLTPPILSQTTTAAAALNKVFSFHTTTAQQAGGVLTKKKSIVVVKHRESRSARIKRKSRERPRPPPPGERKAQRKRIVLSNTNALTVPGLQFLSKDNMTEREQVGQMLALQGTVLDQLRDSKAFKTTQNWNLFRSPSTLMRAETLEMGKDMADVNASREDQGFGARTVQRVITGEQGSGKSIHLLQAMSMGFLNEWIVLHIPECQDFTINNFAYAPLNREGSTPEQIYMQPSLAADILSRLASSNAAILSKLKLNHAHDKSIRVQKHTTLKDLAQMGAEEPSQATSIFFALWKELTVAPDSASHTQNRPSVLVTIDGLDHWMGPTRYRSSDFRPIHAHQFAMVRHFLDALFSPQANPLAYGGMILAATSASNTPNPSSLDLLLKQLDAMQNRGLRPTDPQFPLPPPYSKVDARVLDLLKNASNTSITNLKGLSKPESKGLLEYFAHSGVLKEKITDVFVGNSWSVAGSGIVGQLCKLSARVRVQ